MLTENEVREMYARWTRTVWPIMYGAAVAVCLYFIVMGFFVKPLTSMAANRFGDTARELTSIALILLALPIFLLPSYFAIRYAERFRTSCPLCHQDLSSRTERVLLTRRCPWCGERILEGGRTRSDAVYRRYQEFRSRYFLKYWLWFWPALTALAITWVFFDGSDPLLPVFFPGLLSVAITGWAWIRTFDHRYVPPLLASVVLLGVGALLLWQAL